MSMGQATKIYAKDNEKLALTVTKGHFSSDRFHVNYYIDMTTLKMRQANAEAVAKAMVKKYVNRIELSKSFGISEELLQQSKAFATKRTIDTIICMDGRAVNRPHVPHQLSSAGFNTTNIHKTSYVISPEFDSAGQMVVRENIKPMIKDKHVLVVLASAMSGHTIEKSLRCIESYGGIVEGISVIFGVVSEIEGHPVNAVFSVEDLPDFRLSDPHDCPDCKNHVKLDAIVNSYGYTPLD